MYKWTDKDGTVNFTDTPPPPGARNVQKRGSAPGPADSGQGSFDLQLATKNFPVVLYTAEPCPPCKEARDLLVNRGVPFREVQVSSAARRAPNCRRFPVRTDVPVMTVGKDVQRGYEQGAYQRRSIRRVIPRQPLPGTQQAAQVRAPPRHCGAAAHRPGKGAG